MILQSRASGDVVSQREAEQIGPIEGRGLSNGWQSWLPMLYHDAAFDLGVCKSASSRAAIDAAFAYFNRLSLKTV